MKIDTQGMSGPADPNYISKLSEEEQRQALPKAIIQPCLLYTSPSPRDRQKSRMPSSA